MIDKLHEQMIRAMKTSMPEKTIIEFFLDMENQNIHIKPIGKNENIESEFKNELFDEIYEDEDGTIIDLRIFENKPTQEEFNQMKEYWDELRMRFKKSVQPCFVITGEK